MIELLIAGTLLLSPNASAPPALYLPGFQVDLTSFATTLFAVARNTPDDLTPYFLAMEIHDREGAVVGTLHQELPNLSTITVNLRDWLTLPQPRCPGEDGGGIFGEGDQTNPGAVRDALVDGDGMARGSVRAYLALECPGPSVTSESLVGVFGDYFRVDPVENFASSGRLLHSEDFGRAWESRFLLGFPFDGTVCDLYFPTLEAGELTTVTLGVIDEDGNAVVLFGRTKSVGAYSTIDLGEDLVPRFGEIPPFGRIGFLSSYPFSVACTARAEGRYSVSLPATRLP